MGKDHLSEICSSSQFQRQRCYFFRYNFLPYTEHSLDTKALLYALYILYDTKALLYALYILYDRFNVCTVVQKTCSVNTVNCFILCTLVIRISDIALSETVCVQRGQLKAADRQVIKTGYTKIGSTGKGSRSLKKMFNHNMLQYIGCRNNLINVFFSKCLLFIIIISLLAAPHCPNLRIPSDVFRSVFTKKDPDPGLCRVYLGPIRIPCVL